MAIDELRRTAAAVGARIPAFTSTDQHGVTVTDATVLADGPFLLVFHPLTFSPVCGRELADLGQMPVRVVSLSCDSMFVQRAYAQEYGIAHAMLTDFWPHGAISMAFGVFDAGRGVSARASFAVRGDGTIADRLLVDLPTQRTREEHLALARTLG